MSFSRYLHFRVWAPVFIMPLMVLVFCACDENEDKPAVENPTTANVMPTSATLGGEVTSTGDDIFEGRGVVYSKYSENDLPASGGPNVTKEIEGTNGVGVFSVNITGLDPCTQYVFRAYAANEHGTVYTDSVKFATPGPNVSTPTSADVMKTTATLGGTVTGNGGLAITERGVVFSLTDENSDPLIGDDGVTKVAEGDMSLGAFTVGVTDLLAGEEYSFKAYVSAAGCTDYTEAVIFKTRAAIDVDGQAINSIVPLPDGGTLLAGSFSMLGGAAHGSIARLDTDGMVDATFTTNVNGEINSVVVQPDEKIVIGGSFNMVDGSPHEGIARLNDDGTRDATFTPSADFGIVDGVAIQPDGKILIGGQFLSVNGNARYWWLGRLNTDGTTDTTFNPGAPVFDGNANPDNPVYTIAVQADGKILIGGWFSKYNNIARSGVARLNADGTLDFTFDPGAVTLGTHGVRCIVVQPDGKILIGGDFTTVGGESRNGLARLNPDGSLDEDFFVGPGLDSIRQVDSITLQSDGFILVGGPFSSYGGEDRDGFVRLSPNGFPDPAVDPQFDYTVKSLALAPDGAIQAGLDFGSSPPGPEDLFLVLTNSAAIAAEAVAPVGGGPGGPAPAPEEEEEEDSIALGANGALSKVNVTSPSRVEWLRGGTAPEVFDVRFEVSTDLGSTWTDLGAGTRTTEGWELTGLTITGAGLVRGIGRTFGGLYSTGSGLVTEVADFPIPVVTDFMISEGTTTSVTVEATATTWDSASITERGVVFARTDENNDPVRGGANVTEELATPVAGSGAFTFVVHGLTPGVSYTFRAFATAATTGYSQPSEYWTRAPLITRPTVTNVTGTGATLGGQVTNEGGSPVTERGIVFAPRNLVSSPSVGDGNAVKVTAGSGLGVFTAGSGDLAPGTTYVFRAYATNGVGTSYTTTGTFLTDGPPDVSKETSMSGLSDMSVNLGGEVLADGNSPILERGIIYGPVSAVENDRLLDSEVNLDNAPKMTSAGTTGAFSVSIAGLVPETEYAYAAYATNAHGTEFSDKGFFTTDPAPPSAPSSGLSGGTAAGGEEEEGSDDLQAGSPLAAGTATGVLDETYDADISVDDYVQAIAVRPDGKTIIAGDFNTVGAESHAHIALLNADGTVDSTFTASTDGPVNSVIVQPDGQILIGGIFTKVNEKVRNGIARLNPDGTLEEVTTFIPGGGADSAVYSLALQPDGKILVGGTFTTFHGTARNGIARLKANGALDTSFNPGAGPDDAVYSISVDGDGKILIGGSFQNFAGTPRNGIARLTNFLFGAGSLDTSFDPGTGANDRVTGIAAQPDGSILVSGYFTTIDGTSRNRIARLTSTGALDTSFDPGTGADDHIYTFTTQIDGQIFIGGLFQSYNGTVRNRIARLNADGSLDTTFDPGAGADNEVDAISLLDDGGILIGGIFQNFDGISKKGLARVGNDEATGSFTVVNGKQVTWDRGGAGPEFDQVLFEISTDSGATWTELGAGARTASGWEIADQVLPLVADIRAKGCTTGGFLSGSGGVLEEEAAYDHAALVTGLNAQVRVANSKANRFKKKFKKAKKKKQRKKAKKFKKLFKKFQKQARAARAKLLNYPSP